MRIIAGYTKIGTMKYISHLDLVSAMQRALNRAMIPVQYSMGFNPHPILSFAAPLPVGVEGENEFMDITLNGEIQPRCFGESMNRCLPEGIQIQSCAVVNDARPSLMSAVRFGEYEIAIEAQPDLIDEKIRFFLEQPEVCVEKSTKKGKKSINVRSMVHQLFFRDHCIRAMLDTGSISNLNTDIFMIALFGKSVHTFDYHVRRIQLYIQNESKIETFLIWQQGGQIWENK